MKTFTNLSGGGSYLAPEITVTAIAIERGFEVSLPSINVEDGENWIY